PGAPELVGDEQQEQHADPDEGPPEPADRPPDRRLATGRRAAAPPWSPVGAPGSVDPIPMGPVVHLRAAVCLLGRFPALAGADLDAETGEIVLLTGPNGA